MGGKQAAAEADLVSASVKRVGVASEEASVASKKSSSSFSAMGSSMKNLLGLGALAGVAYGLKDIVGAGVEWQRQQTALQSALRNTGQYSKSTVTDIASAVDKLSTHGGFAPETELGVMAGLVAETGNYKAALAGLSATTDLARGTGLTFTRAQMMVQMALQGSTGRLSKYIGPLIAVKSHVDALTASQKKNRSILDQAELMDKAATAKLVLARVEQRFGNATSRYANTAAGKLSNLKNMIQQVAITMGTKLLPILTAVVGAIAGFITQHKTATMVLLGLVAALGVLWGAFKAGQLVAGIYNDTIGLVKKIGQMFVITTEAETAATEELNVAMSLNPFAIAVVAIVALIAVVVLVVTHFKTFKKVVADVGKFIADVFNGFMKLLTKVIDWIGKHWKLLLEILTFPITGFVAFAVLHFNQIINFIGGIPAKIARVAKNIWEGLKHGLLHVVKWIIKQITNIPGEIVHGAVSAFHAIGSVLGLAGGGVVPKHYASGGVVVGGSGNRDTVPALLTPGEGVLSVAVMKLIGKRDFGIPTIGQASGEGGTIVAGDIPITIQMDSRKLAEGMQHYQLKIAARR